MDAPHVCERSIWSSDCDGSAAEGRESAVKEKNKRGRKLASRASFFCYDPPKRGPFHAHFMPNHPPNTRSTGTTRLPWPVGASGSVVVVGVIVCAARSTQASRMRHVRTSMAHPRSQSQTTLHPHTYSSTAGEEAGSGGGGGACCTCDSQSPLPLPHTPLFLPCCLAASTALELS